MQSEELKRNCRLYLLQVALVFGGLLLFCIVGRIDYEAEQAEQAAYCENVKSGLWPDYEGTYSEDCILQPTAKKVTKRT